MTSLHGFRTTSHVTLTLDNIRTLVVNLEEDIFFKLAYLVNLVNFFDRPFFIGIYQGFTV